MPTTDFQGMQYITGATVNKKLHPFDLTKQIRRGQLCDWYGTGGSAGYNMAVWNTANLAVASSGAAQIDGFVLPGAIGNGYVEMYQSVGQALYPKWDATNHWLEIGGDQVDNDAVEYNPGGNSADSPFAYVVGTSIPVVMRAALTIEDVSGSDSIFFGWRKQEPGQATPYSTPASPDPVYTDVYGFQINAGTVNAYSDLNNGGTATVTDTLFDWADGKTHVLEMRIYGRKPKLFINGVPLGGTVKVDGTGAALTAQPTIGPPAFSFDLTDTLIPSIYILQKGADLTLVGLKALQIGPLVSFGLDPNNE